MPRNGSGSYTLPEAPFVSGTTISSTVMNSQLDDIADALTASLTADGQTPITGQLQASAGTLATPIYGFVLDETAGMYLPAESQIALVAGGVGIKSSNVAFQATVAVISAAGTGYAVGDTITLTGGTAVTNTVLTVATLSGTGVATVTITVAGRYTVAPSNAVAQGSTSGSGSGATFTMTYAAAALVSTAADAALWPNLGASDYMAAAMGLPNGNRLANYIGASNIAAIIATSLPLPVPQGRLTLTSNTPVLATGVTAGTVVYWTPYQGLWAPIHNGTTLIPYVLSGQLSLTLTSSQSASGIFDISLAYNSGTPVIGTGPNWSAGTSGSVTAGSCARGTGAGGTALSRLLGFYTNTASMSLIWNTGSGNTTITVAANQGVYLGSIFIDGTQGQVSCLTAYGQSRKWGVWNCFNRKKISMVCGDNTASWSYGTDTFRPCNNSTANSLTVFTGLTEEYFDLNFNSKFYNGGTTAVAQNGIGWNVTNAASGLAGTTVGTTPTGDVSQLTATFQQTPKLGINVVTALEKTGETSTTFYGTEANLYLSGKYEG